MSALAMRRLVDCAKFKLAPPAGDAGLPLRDLSAHLASAKLSEWDSKSLLREAGIALPARRWFANRDELVRRSPAAAFHL